MLARASTSCWLIPPRTASGPEKQVCDTRNLTTLLEGDQDLLESRDSDGSTALHHACWKGHLEAVRFLVQAGADLQVRNTNDHCGTTPLHAATHANQAAIALLSIEAGADVNARGMNGQTLLHHTGFRKARAAAGVPVKHGGM